MKRALIITVAGTSTRFNQSIGGEWLKCLYYEGNSTNSLLYQIVSRAKEYDQIIIVGGYKYVDLVAYVESLQDKRIMLVYNEHFIDYGSGYSFYLGLKAVDADVDEITFVEGDLYYDTKSFEEMQDAEGSVLCVNHELILSNKAVVLYFDMNHRPHYIYDTSHKALQIGEPFEAIYNSGQMWKFMNPSRVREICQFLTPEQEQGTNLEIIQKYFGAYNNSQLDIISVNLWFNCNTVADYREAIKALIA